MSGAFARMMACDSPSFEYVRVLTRMLHDEPIVHSAVATLQAHCLRHGVFLKWGDTSPTPQFQRHIAEYYEPFCRDALVAFLTVGFAPFRMRKEGTRTVPEILPLGTYTWTVARTQQAKRMRDDGTQIPRDIPLHNPPLLRYDVTSMYCNDTIYVFNFESPHPNLTSTGPLSSLIGHFLALEAHRSRATQADEWNCKPNMSLEDTHDKENFDNVLQTAQCLHNMHGQLLNTMRAEDIERRRDAIQQFIDDMKKTQNIPDNGTVVAPQKNQSFRSLDKVEPPPEMHKRELFFARLVALALGIPPSFAMQGTSGFASSASSGRSSWQDSPEVFTRALTETCLRLNRALEGLLTLAYHHIYGALFDGPNGRGDGVNRRMPRFHIPVAPTLPMEQLLPLFDAQLLDDTAYSHILEVSLGFPMHRQSAIAARADRHKAANVLPFQDRKEPPK